MTAPERRAEERAADVIPITRTLKPELIANMGMALFLFSWGITFVGLTVAYLVIWSRTPVWPPLGTPPRPLSFPLFNTVFVLASSVTYDLAVRAARRARASAVRRWMAATGALATAFLVLQGVMWWKLWSSGLRVGHNNYAGLFYALTVFHAAHVVAGLGLLLALTPRALQGRFTVRDHAPLRLGGWFWHFVTAAWVVIFFLLWAL